MTRPVSDTNRTRHCDDKYICFNLETISIPDSVQSIGKRAFLDCTKLKAVKVPQGVTTVNEFVFYDCSSLEEVTLPDGLIGIGERAFQNCDVLTALEIPTAVTSIGEYAFAHCDNLDNMVLPEDINEIGPYTFFACYSLSEINIPASVTVIGDEAFGSCDDLEKIIFGGAAPDIHGTAFSDVIADALYPENYGWQESDFQDYGGTIDWIPYSISTHVHNYETVIIDPTCTTDGYTEHTCLCGDTYVDSEIAALGHSWDGGVVTKAPTENATGVRTYTCNTCSAIRTEEINQLVHEHLYTTEVTAPTCVEKGFTTYNCSCGASYIDNEVPASGHTEVIDAAVAATCTESGLTEGSHCSVCKEIIIAQVSIAPTGHSYTEGICETCGVKDPDHPESDPAPTDPEETPDVLIISDQQTISDQTINSDVYITSTGRATFNNVTVNGDIYCHGQLIANDCTANNVYAYAYGSMLSCDAFDGTHGLITGSLTCNSLTITDDALDYAFATWGTGTDVPPDDHVHQFASVVTAPTCTTGGYTTYTCTCGDSYTGDEVAALGHTEVTDVAVPATCTKTGLTEGSTCSVCGEILIAQEETPMVDHCYVDGICSVCGMVESTTSPNAPVILSCYSKLQTSVKVTWTIDENADGYELWRTATPDDEDSWIKAKTITSGTTDRYTNQGLEVGVTYYYKIRAYADNADGTRSYSEFSNVDYMPAAVVFDGPYSNATSRIRLRWNEVGGAHGYQIWRMNEDGSWKIVKTLGNKGNELTNDQGGTTAYSNTGLAAGNTYTYKMRAFMITEDGKKVFGAYSDEYSVAVRPDVPMVAGSSPKATRAKLIWDAVNGAAGYQIWMSDSVDGEYKIVKSVTDGSTSYTKYDLTSGKTYYFKVRAYAEAQEREAFSAYSEVVAITIE